MAKKIGEGTIVFEKDIRIRSAYSVVAEKEGRGPLHEYFDRIEKDMMLREKSWEKAESILQKTAAEGAVRNAGLKKPIDFMFSGDLLNQCIGSAYGLRDLFIPFLGLYGACSTMAEGLGIAATFIESGGAENTLSLTSSHFCSSERQFRFPLEYGGVRTPTAQWTVTGSGAVVLSPFCKELTGAPRIASVCFGKITDLGIKDINNMGAAMAPAAADTIERFLDDTSSSPSDYDYIFTGDLGSFGSELLIKLLKDKNIDISAVHRDCGVMIYSKEEDVHAGGSGCGCSASVLTSYVYKNLLRGTFKNVLFIATGALMSTVSNQQKETIPAVAHLLNIKVD